MYLNESSTSPETQILNLGCMLLTGKATEDNVAKTVELAKKHNLLPLLHQELQRVTDSLLQYVPNPTVILNGPENSPNPG